MRKFVSWKGRLKEPKPTYHTILKNIVVSCHIRQTINSKTPTVAAWPVKPMRCIPGNTAKHLKFVTLEIGVLATPLRPDESVT